MGAEGSDSTMPWITISSRYTGYILGKHYYVLFKNFFSFQLHYISLHHFHTKKTIVCMNDTSAIVKMHQTKFPTNFNHLWDSGHVHKEIRNRQEITEGLGVWGALENHSHWNVNSFMCRTMVYDDFCFCSLAGNLDFALRRQNITF